MNREEEVKNERVLIIDDNKVFLEELRETLYLCGYDPRIVCDSTDAFSTARTVQPDLILLDLRMSGKNGFQVAEELKKSQETKGIPIIAMSGYFPIEKQPALLDMSKMDGRLAKPFSMDDLISLMETMLDRKKNDNVRPGAEYEEEN